MSMLLSGVNSYCSREEADAYFAEQGTSGVWHRVSVPARETALLRAFAALERLEKVRHLAVEACDAAYSDRRVVKPALPSPDPHHSPVLMAAQCEEALMLLCAFLRDGLRKSPAVVARYRATERQPFALFSQRSAQLLAKISTVPDK